jgi:hypothetical protein
VAYINAGRYKAVPYSAIDKENPYAMVSQSPTGDTVWGQHILVAISPAVYNEEKVQPEEYAKARAAQNRASIEGEINRAFGRGGYKGQYGIEDVRKER